MASKTIHCAECVEDIPNDEVTWEDGRLYCGRCGSELEADAADRDLLDEISGSRPRRAFLLDDDVDEEEEDEELDDEDDEEWDEEEEEEEA